MATKTVSKYRVIVRSGAPTRYQEDLISLYDGRGAHIANLRFTDASAPGKSTSGGYTTIIYPRSAYLHAIDLLRNESPVYFVEDNADEGGLRTSTGEPVGENE
ncbi:MAG: hypothetical protein KC486_19345 [Myxococcales bacterium]|nr:hypothetical protein [Myxococcales bacterium]